jgi:hypothetical protein
MREEGNKKRGVKRGRLDDNATAQRSEAVVGVERGVDRPLHVFGVGKLVATDRVGVVSSGGDVND